MKENGIYVDLHNSEQVNWWNNIASKLVKTVYYSTVVETATNKPVGVLIMINGLFKDYVIKENTRRFLSDRNTVTACFEIKD